MKKERSLLGMLFWIALMLAGVGGTAYELWHRDPWRAAAFFLVYWIGKRGWESGDE